MRAAEWLEKNMPQNRKVKQGVVNKIAADITANKWIMDGNPIKFNTAGFLIDGQHRLHAIVKAGKPVQTVVCYDVDSQAINTLDTGAARSTADVLSLNGIAGSSKMIAALARRILSYKTGTGLELRGKRKAISNQQILAFCQDNDLAPYVNYGMNCFTQALTRELLNSGEWQFTYWLLAQTHEADAQKFCMNLAKLRDKDAPAIRTLFEALSRSAVMGDIVTKMKLIITAWNAWRKGQDADLKLRKIQMAEIPELV